MEQLEGNLWSNMTKPYHAITWFGLPFCLTGSDHHGHGLLAKYVKLCVAYALGMPGTFSPPLRVSDPDMHHVTCVTHVPWCMPGSLTSGFLWSLRRENVPCIPDACATRTFTCLARGSCQKKGVWCTEGHNLCFWSGPSRFARHSSMFN